MSLSLIYPDKESDLNNTQDNSVLYSPEWFSPGCLPKKTKCYYCDLEACSKYTLYSYVYTPDPFGKFILKNRNGKIKIDKNGEIKKFNREYIEKHFCNNCKLGSRYNESDKKFVNKKLLKYNLNKQNVNIDLINSSLLKFKM